MLSTAVSGARTLSNAFTLFFPTLSTSTGWLCVILMILGCTTLLDLQRGPLHSSHTTNTLPVTENPTGQIMSYCYKGLKQQQQLSQSKEVHTLLLLLLRRLETPRFASSSLLLLSAPATTPPAPTPMAPCATSPPPSSASRLTSQLPSLLLLTTLLEALPSSTTPLTPRRRRLLLLHRPRCSSANPRRELVLQLHACWLLLLL